MTSGDVPGPIRARPTAPGDFLSLAGTEGFVELPPGTQHIREGFRDEHVPLVSR